MKSAYNGLLVIVVIVTVLALGNLIITIDKVGTLTGHLTETGTANLTIESVADISFVVSNINWQSGRVDEANSSATLDSEGTLTDGNWTQVSEGLRLRNNGNVNVSLNLTTSNGAAGFIGGTNPTYKLKLVENETGSCAGILGFNTTYQDAPESTSTSACTIFEFVDVRDYLNIEVEVVIPEDALAGAKGSIITATATAI